MYAVLDSGDGMYNICFMDGALLENIVGRQEAEKRAFLLVMLYRKQVGIYKDGELVHTVAYRRG